jgi:Flp pilus assembly protein TadG
MFAMFFGIIDVCYAVSIQSLLSQAVRAGSRWAVTYQSTYNSTTCSSQATCITQVVVDNAVGFLSANSSYIVVNYYVPPNLSTPVMSCSAGTCTASTVVTLPYTYSVTTGTSTTTVTISYANQPGNIVEVDIPAYPLLWMVPIKGYTAGSQVTNSSGQTGLGLSLSADAMDVLGNLPQGLTPPTP